MSSREQWELFQRWLFHDEETGFRLDVSRMGIPEGAVAQIRPRFEEAFDAMESLERGEIANPSEGRRVGHYWLRAPERAPSEDLRRVIVATRDSVVEFAAQVHAGIVRPPEAERFRRLLVVGIGGSALGPQFVADALGGAADRLVPRFLDNTDPDGIDRVVGSLGRDLVETLCLVVSKSGGTPETRNGMLETAAAFRARGLELGPHAVAITQEGSELDRYARTGGFLGRFPMWDWVGGRTSVLSAVGLLPAALQGIDVAGLLAGAAAMDRLTRRREVERNPAALLALAWHHAGDGRGEKAMVVLPYKDRLALFGRYLQQLVMESLGKERDRSGAIVRQGLSVYGNKGSTDQHAYVQQLRDGRADFFATFVEVRREREGPGIEVEPEVTSGDFLGGFLLGTRQALHDNGRGSITLSIPAVSPEAVGMLIALYERAVGLYASLVGINAYDQPGVEAGKQAAASVLALQCRVVAALRRRGPDGGTCEGIAADAGASAEVETVFHILERLAANPSRGVLRTPGGSPVQAIYRAATY